MSDVPARLRRLVLQRVGSRCEYCGLSQEGQEASFHVDHIMPKAAQGPTRADNWPLPASRAPYARRRDGLPSIRWAVAKSLYSIRVASDGETTFVGREFASWA